MQLANIQRYNKITGKTLQVIFSNPGTSWKCVAASHSSLCYYCELPLMSSWQYGTVSSLILEDWNVSISLRHFYLFSLLNISLYYKNIFLPELKKNICCQCFQVFSQAYLAFVVYKPFVGCLFPYVLHWRWIMEMQKYGFLIHRGSKNCDTADPPLASQNHCHCQDCLVVCVPLVLQNVLTDDGRLSV